MSSGAFKAPTEDIELELINFCVEQLELGFGDFWYQWFTSNNIDNASIHIDCNDDNLTEKIRKQFSSLSFFDFFHKGGIKLISMPEYTEFRYKYHLHIKLKLTA